MVATLSIRLPEELLEEIDRLATRLKLPRAQYIRKAIESMNKEVLAEQKRARLVAVSHRVRQNSLDVNAEFSEIEHDPAS